MATDEYSTCIFFLLMLFFYLEGSVAKTLNEFGTRSTLYLRFIREVVYTKFQTECLFMGKTSCGS